MRASITEAHLSRILRRRSRFGRVIGTQTPADIGLSMKLLVKPWLQVLFWSLNSARAGISLASSGVSSSLLFLMDITIEFGFILWVQALLIQCPGSDWTVLEVWVDVEGFERSLALVALRQGSIRKKIRKSCLTWDCICRSAFHLEDRFDMHPDLWAWVQEAPMTSLERLLHSRFAPTWDRVYQEERQKDCLLDMIR